MPAQLSKIHTGAAHHLLDYSMLLLERGYLRAIFSIPAQVEQSQGALMQATNAPTEKLDVQAQSFYGDVLDALLGTGIPFLVGGGYAFAVHTSIHRQTKDLDIFVQPRDKERTLQAAVQAGYRTEITFEHWLAKILSGDDFIDVIFSSGNGLAEVNDIWFAQALDADVLGRPVRLCAPEEMIWSKAFIMERERYDGADIAHLLRQRGAALDWVRLLQHFGEHYPVLLSHLILYSYIYPDEPSPVPDDVMAHLLAKWNHQRRNSRAGAPICRGPLLSRAQYLVDTEDWGYQDVRLRPTGTMTEEEVASWTEAIPAELRHERNHEKAQKRGRDPSRKDKF